MLLKKWLSNTRMTENIQKALWSLAYLSQAHITPIVMELQIFPKAF